MHGAPTHRGEYTGSELEITFILGDRARNMLLLLVCDGSCDYTPSKRLLTSSASSSYVHSRDTLTVTTGTPSVPLSTETCSFIHPFVYKEIIPLT